MAIWLRAPGQYEDECVHCGWRVTATDLATSRLLMAAHTEADCRWWEAAPVAAVDAA